MGTPDGFGLKNLTDSDRQSPVWIKIETELRKRLDALRVQNDKELSLSDTSMLRGRIAELKRMLGFNRPSIEEGQSDY